MEQIEKKQEHERQRGATPKKTVAEEVESEKNKDRESVRSYVPIIARTECRIECMGAE